MPKTLEPARHRLLLLAIACLACADSDPADGGVDGGAACAGGLCAALNQSCPDGQVVSGVDPDGTLICVDQVRLRQQTCNGRLVVSGIRSDGSVMCVDPITTVRCGVGEVLTGIDESGEPECSTVDALVRDYVNSRCYLYLGWRDSCDGCSEPPVKVGRVRGDAMDCGVAGDNGTCATFSLFGQDVDMVSINTDGDVNDDDKFWVGVKCE